MAVGRTQQVICTGSSSASCSCHFLTIPDETMLLVYRQSGSMGEHLLLLVRVCRQLFESTIIVLVPSSPTLCTSAMPAAVEDVLAACLTLVTCYTADFL